MRPTRLASALFICAVLIVAAGVPVSAGAGRAAAQSSDVAPPPDPVWQLIVKLKAGAGPGQVTAALGREQLQSLSAVAGVPLTDVRVMWDGAHVVGLPERLPHEQAARLAARLAALPEVEYAEPDAIMRPALVPTDPEYSAQWHYFEAQGINLPAAWDVITGSTGIYIAVLDTGITVHPDLDGRWAGGYDFISAPSVAVDGDGRDPDPHDPGDWYPANGCGVPSPAQNSSWHGTHVAGTIGAAADGAGVVGVNWVSQLVIVRVLGKCGGLLSDIAEGMLWAAGLSVSGVPANLHPARVINLSLGGQGSCSATYQNAINAVVAQGAVVVVAAGNSNADASGYQPANCNGVITVAATTRSGSRAAYSNYGSLVDISAPGGSTSANSPSPAPNNAVLSTLNAGTTVPAAASYGFYQGTSMAAPHVAGVASLMLSANPALTPSQVAQILRNTARAFPGGSTCNTSICGSGIVDAGAALQGALNPAGNDHKLYLPLIRNGQAAQAAGLGGRVTEQGMAASGIQLRLYRYSGGNWSFTGTTVTTNANGDYLFTGLAALAPGQRYGACFENSSNPNRLSGWCTRDLPSYAPGDAVHLGDFDIANVHLSAPAAGATVGLPFTFQWQTRAAMPADNYEFNLYDWDTLNPYFYTNPALGFTGSYTLNGLPAGFVPDHQYVWEMWILGQDGSFGISYWAYAVTFSNAGMSITAVERAGLRESARLRFSARVPQRLSAGE
jgi:serine protease